MPWTKAYPMTTDPVTSDPMTTEPIISDPKTLADNEIHLFITQPDRISDPGLLQQYEALLADEERAKLPNFYHQRHRHQFLITRALQRTSLSEFCDVEPAQWRFAKGTYGKPEIIQPTGQQPKPEITRPTGQQPKPEITHITGQTPLSFNLSHTAGLIICGIVKGAEIGVDVEDRQRSTRAAFSSLFSYFSEEEISQLETLPGEQQKQRFFEHWTLKEAYIKARGAGFAIPLSQFGFLFENDQIETFFVSQNLQDNANDWQFWQGRYAERYPIAIALRSDKRNLKVIPHDCVPLQHTARCDGFKLSHFSNN